VEEKGRRCALLLRKNGAGKKGLTAAQKNSILKPVEEENGGSQSGMGGAPRSIGWGVTLVAGTYRVQTGEGRG
jgi:hypothetical protein